MDLDGADPKIPASHATDHNPEVERSTPPTTGSAMEKDDATDGASQPDPTTRDNHKPLARGPFDLGDEIQILKTKILELEKHTEPKPNAPTQEASRPQLMTEIEQYKRMEACLYRHRKEWEQAGGRDRWSMGILVDSDYIPVGRGDQHGPWNYHWNIESTRHYNRPNPFDPSHVCADDQSDTEPPHFDDFDHAIDYGARRERLRKTFEWEMDRLYLVEEMERRKMVESQKKHTSHDEKPKKDAQPEEKEPRPPAVKISRLEWLSFKADPSNDGGGFVIEILEGEPILDDFGPSRSWYGYSGRRAHVKDRSLNLEASSTTLSEQKPLPERIRIRSPVLLQILRTILGPEHQHRWRSDEVAVLIGPFKVLVYCERALRDWCSALEKKFQARPITKEDDAVGENSSIALSQEQESPTLQHTQEDLGQDLSGEDTAIEKLSAAKSDSQGSETSLAQEGDRSQRRSASEQGQEDEADEEEQELGKDDDHDDGNDVTKSPMALDHLKCLLSFIDSNISARQKYLDHQSCRKVVFSDLWLLFRPGLEVIGSDGKQAYRVIHTTSAKHRVMSAWQKWLNHSAKKRKDSPFSITCVYIDFDGRDFGPVQRVFDFKRFDGETEISSLEVYPLRFHPAKEANFSEPEWKKLNALPAEDRHRQRLIDRGAKFLDVAAVKHMYYAGPTMEERDDVESQVVIDFETAFSKGGDTGRAWKPELRPLIGLPAVEDGEEKEDEQDYPCSAKCCYHQFVHDDTYVDQKQRDEYVESLLPKTSAPDEQPSIAVIPRPLKELQASHHPRLPLSDDELVIMSYRVFGFVLRTRKWGMCPLQVLDV